MRKNELTNFKSSNRNNTSFSGDSFSYSGDIKIINSTSQLSGLVESILHKEEKDVLLSFKLQKENAYDLELSAIGVISGNSKYIIDLMSSQPLNLSIFIDNVLHNSNLLKVIFDINFFLDNISRFFELTYPVFDVASAAMFCGFGDRLTAKDIVARKLNQIPNARVLANPRWGSRPLNTILLEYFSSELNLFKQSYEIIKEEIVSNNRVQWFNEFIIEKLLQSNKIVDPTQVWRGLKFSKPSMETIKRARALCFLRVELAQKFKVNPAHIFNDDTLKEIAEEGPTLPEDLIKIRGIPPKIKKTFYIKKIIGTILAANKESESEISLEEFNYLSLPSTYIPLVDMLKILLRVKSQEYNISQKLIADVYELAMFVFHPQKEVNFMKGWRHEVFGKDAQALKNGEIGLMQEGNMTVLMGV